MNELELCRLCANFANESNAQKIFDSSQQNLLRKAEELTGLQLENAADLPQFICATCQEKTLQAHEFRECCIRVQKQFAKAACKLQLNNQQLSEEYKLEEREELLLPPVEEVFFEADVKAENEIEEHFRLSDAEDHFEPFSNSLQIDDCELETNEEHDRLSGKKEQATPDNTGVIAFKTMTLNESTTTKTVYIAKIEEQTSKKQNKKISKVDQRKCKPKQHFICDQCGRNFHCLSYFEVHQSRHAGEKQFQCELCPDKFFTKADLKRHTYKHTGERPIQCRYCDRRFIDHSLRTKHERTHTNERSHACTECNKTFNQKQHLVSHMQLHTGERFFSCALCTTTFQRKSNLNAHYSTQLHKQNLEKKQKLENQTNTLN